MSISEIATIVIAAGTLVGVFVWGVAGKSKSESNEAIMQENTSLRNQLGDAKSENMVLIEKARKSAENEQTFKDLALGKPDYEKLSVQLTQQHKEILQSFKGLTEGVSKLATTIAKDRKNG